MKKKNLIVVVLAVLIGIIVGLLFSLAGHNDAAPAPVAETPTVDTPTPTNAAPAAASNSPAPAKNSTPSEPKVAGNGRVLFPTAPPAQAPKPVQNNQSAPPLTDEETKAIVNNLRQLAAAGNSYMLDKGVTQATFYDLVGTGTDDYLHPLKPVAGEDYQDVIIHEGDTQISVAAPDGSDVIFND